MSLSVLQSGITITGPDEVAAGKTVKLTARGPKVKWSIVSTEPAVSKVTDVSIKGGRLKVAVSAAPGTVITIKAAEDDKKKSEGEKKTAVYTVTIKKNDTKASVRIKLDDTEITGKMIGIDRDVMSPVVLGAEVLGSGGRENISQNISWKSSAPKVAVVDSSGTVTPLSAGTARITATTTDGTKKSAAVTVNVASLVRTISITVSDTIAKSTKASSSGKYTAAVTPVRAANKKIKWSVSCRLPAGSGISLKPADVRISNGVLKISKKVPAGTVITLKAVASDGSGVSAEKAVTVITAQ